MAVWALNVNKTDLLVAAIEFAASSCPRKMPSKLEKTIFEISMKWNFFTWLFGRETAN